MYYKSQYRVARKNEHALSACFDRPALCKCGHLHKELIGMNESKGCNTITLCSDQSCTCENLREVKNNLEFIQAICHGKEKE